MTSSTPQLVLRAAIVIGIAALSVSVIVNSTAITPTVERGRVNAPAALTGRHGFPLSEMDARLSDRQQLRRIFIDDLR
jgi:hypothetical protein